MKKIITIILLLFVFIQSNSMVAQDLLKDTDLGTVKVDYLSDTEIAKIDSQLKARNLTIDEVRYMALEKGMSPLEFTKLKERLTAQSNMAGDNNKKDKDNYYNEDSSKDSNKDSKMDFEEDNKKEYKEDEYGRKQEKFTNKKVKDSLNALVFGSELFDKPTLNFEPSLKLATPVNYILGPGDELQISVYGVQEFNTSAPVSVEGKVKIQYVGQISVAGMTIEAATQKIKKALANIYSTVNSGQSQVGVTLSRIRTIKITLIGSKQPGNYSVSSLATVYNALFLGGGPAKNGSYRNIELLRNNKIYKTIDIYSFLVNGNQSDNVGLKDNDVIRIPAYTQRVTVQGQVKRSGIFEMKKGETFKDLLSFASGFNEFAYTVSVHVTQKTNKEFKVKDINESEYATYQPNSGDVFRVSKILNRFENRIKIEGAVFRPNIYSYYEGMRISDLVAQAEGLKEDAYTSRATIVRLQSDLTKEVTNVDLNKALAGDLQANIVMQREDIVTVYSILDFVDKYTITIDGEIKKPGIYDYHDSLTLNDLIVQSGGLMGSASKRVEVARMLKSDEIDDANLNRVQLFNLEINAGSNEQAQNFPLEPFDVINIRRMAVYEKPEMVLITGAVNYTGKYVLANKKEKLSSVIERAGGLTSIANINGVKIKRPIQAKQIEELENIDMNFDKKQDTIKNKLTKKLIEDVKYATIPIDWKRVLKRPNDKSNVTLFPGDEIEVSVYNESVKVTGNVLLTSEIPYNKGRRFNYYLSSVGGIDAKGWKKKTYIIYPNGRAAVSKSYFLFRTYPKVLPGSQIVVPEKPVVKKITTGEIVGIASVLASLAGVVIAIISLK